MSEVSKLLTAEQAYVAGGRDATAALRHAYVAVTSKMVPESKYEAMIISELTIRFSERVQRGEMLDPYSNSEESRA